MRDFIGNMAHKASLPDLRDPKALGAYLTYYDDGGRPGDAAIADPAYLSDPFVDALVENVILYAAADCETWALRAARALVVPMKKLDFIESLPEKIAEFYLDGKSDDAEYWFDLYNALITALKNGFPQIAATHAYALSRMRNTGAPENLISAAQDAFSACEKRLDALFTAENPSALPSVSEAKARRSARQREALLEAGVAAEETYRSAIENAAAGKTVSALNSFRKLGDYEDSVLRAIELNRHAKLGNLRVYGGKQFVLVPKKVFLSHKDGKTEIPESKAGSADTELDAFHLCPYENGLPGLPIGPAFKSIVGHFGGRLFVLNTESALCSLSVKTGKVAEIFDGSTAYRFENGVDAVKCEGGEIALVGKSMNVLVNGRKQTVSLGADSLLLLDPAAPALKNTQEGAVRIVKAIGGCVFYETNVGDVRVYTVKTGKVTELCKASDCPEICAVSGDDLFYLAGERSAPALKRRKIDGGDTEVIEDHVCEYVYANGEAIFYTVGNRSEKALYAYFYKNRARKEVLRRVFCGENDPIVCEQNGFLYVRAEIEGKCGLCRVRSDGSDCLLLSKDFARPACDYPFRRGNFFYLDSENALVRVGVSGGRVKQLATGISEFGCPGIFGERVVFTKDDGEPGTCGLYSSDFDGSDLRKLANKIAGVAVLDENRVVVLKPGDYKTVTVR